MHKIKLEHIKIDGELKVTTPYNADFVAKCRNFRGKWKKEENAWYFDDSIIEHVRKAMIDFFGTTGEKPYNNCILEVCNFTHSAMTAPVILFGRTIAKAFGRDSGARLGDDIVLIDGDIDSGGSAKNWSTNIINATFRINNFPEPSLDLPEVKKAIDEGWVKVIKDDKNKRSEKEIRADIADLLAKVDELQKELEELNNE